MTPPVPTGDTVVTGSGRSLSRYVCLQRIARGGMAELYLARREGPAGFRKLVALKRLLPHLAEDPAFARMFITEARLAAGLEHPHLAQVLDFGELDGRSFLAMEYIHGQDLRGVLQSAGRTLSERRIPLPCALTVVDMVADGLHYAHERHGPGGRPLGLVHRDVSPSNVLVGYDGTVKLVDFGIAKATAETQATATHSLKGKIAYMSPEQARGEPVDRRSDVFSLGIVLFELTTGYRLFTGPSEFVILNQVARGEIAAPRDVVPDYPEDLQRIVLRALALSVDQRYPTADALSRELREFAMTAVGWADRRGLSQMMETLFEVPAYPDIDAVPVNHEAIELGPTTRSRYELAHDDTVPVSAPEPSPPRRVPPWGWAAVTLGVGVGLGVALTGMQQGEPPTPGPTIAPSSAPPVAKPSGASTTTDGEHEESATTSSSAAKGDSSGGGTQPLPSTATSRRARRSRPRRTKDKPVSKESGLDRWKPPSEQ